MKQKHWQFVRSNPRLTCSERDEAEIVAKGNVSFTWDIHGKTRKKVLTVFICYQGQEGTDFPLHKWESATV